MGITPSHRPPAPAAARTSYHNPSPWRGALLAAGCPSGCGSVRRPTIFLPYFPSLIKQLKCTVPESALTLGSRQPTKGTLTKVL